MKRNRLGKWLCVGGVWTATMMALGVAGSGCLARNVGSQDPTTKVNFTSTVAQAAVDKVDLLFAIDNSGSMGDKQSILADAVPDLLDGLLRPRCVDVDLNPAPSGTRADPLGTKENHFGCAFEGGKQYEPEFKPVTDMHIGIVSSSLGGMGGDACAVDGATPNPRNNDRAQLINLKGAGGQVELATPQGFLAWFPSVQENQDSVRHPEPAKATRTVDDLKAGFAELVVGVGQTGCGLEAQLESMYHFLIAPDPWTEIKVAGDGRAAFAEGIDLTILKQRADFLRPDSLVAIIMLTDEDDSSADPLSVGGQGWAFMSNSFPGSKVLRGSAAQGTTAPRGTSACDTNPGSEACTSCAFQYNCADADPKCQAIKNDPNCKAEAIAGKNEKGYLGYYPPTDDDLNVRFHRMKKRYGIDPQYPIKRYVDGLTKSRIPDRAAEHEIVKNPDGTVATIKEYTSTPKCQNPLFAAKLPTGESASGFDYCNLLPSTRSPDQVFFAVVGGVPHQLLHFVPNNPDKSRITSEDWVKILGNDPLNFDYAGIDPHMVQSVEPREGLSGADKAKGDNGSDPYNGREWNTNKKDLQYACTFDLPVDKQRKCTSNSTSCDCGENTNPPLCKADNTQVKAKAYPTIREFEVVRALGDQGIIASLCPIQLDDKNQPTYGYRPAVASIIDRLAKTLTAQCLPRRLRVKPAEGELADKVPCLVLAQLSDPNDSCKNHSGLKDVAPEILTVFRQQQKAESGNVGDGGINLAALPVCEVPQKDPVVQPGDSCKTDENPVWCYVENDKGAKPAGPRCSQAVILSSGTAGLTGARFSLQCIGS